MISVVFSAVSNVQGYLNCGCGVSLCVCGVSLSASKLFLLYPAMTLMYMSLAQCSYICIYITVCPPCLCAVFTLFVNYLFVVCFPYTSVCGLFMCIFYVLMLQCYVLIKQQHCRLSPPLYLLVCTVITYVLCVLFLVLIVQFQIGRERGKFSKEVRGKPMRE